MDVSASEPWMRFALCANSETPNAQKEKEKFGIKDLKILIFWGTIKMIRSDKLLCVQKFTDIVYQMYVIMIFFQGGFVIAILWEIKGMSFFL